MHKNLIIWLITGFLVLQSTAIAAAADTADRSSEVVVSAIVAPALTEQLADWQAIFTAAPSSADFMTVAMKKVTQGADYVRQFVKNAEMLDILARMQGAMTSAAGRNELTGHILNRYFLMLGLIQEPDLDQPMSKIPGRVLSDFNILKAFYEGNTWKDRIETIATTGAEGFFPPPIEETLALSHETIKPAVVFAPEGGIAHPDILQGYFEGEMPLHLVGLGLGLSKTGVHGGIIRNPAFFILHDLLHYKQRVKTGGFWERPVLQPVYDKYVKGKPKASYTAEDWRHTIGLFWITHESPQREKIITDGITKVKAGEGLTEADKALYNPIYLASYAAYGMAREFENLTLFLQPEIVQCLQEETSLQKNTKWKLWTLSLQPAQASVGEPWTEALYNVTSILDGPPATHGPAMRAWFLHMKASGLLSTIGQVLQGESPADIAETQVLFTRAIDALAAGEVKEDASFQDLMRFMSSQIGYTRFKSIINKMMAWSIFIRTDIAPRDTLHLVRFEYKKKIEGQKSPILEGTMVLSFDPRAERDTPFKIHRLIQDPFMVPDPYSEEVVLPRAEDAAVLQAAFAEAVAKLTGYEGVTLPLPTERAFHLRDHLYELGPKYTNKIVGALKDVSLVGAAEAIYKLLTDVSNMWGEDAMSAVRHIAISGGAGAGVSGP